MFLTIIKSIFLPLAQFSGHEELSCSYSIFNWKCCSSLVLCWVLVALLGFLCLWWRVRQLSWCGAWAPALQWVLLCWAGLQSTWAAVIVAHGLAAMACGIFPDEGWAYGIPTWQVDSETLNLRKHSCGFLVVFKWSYCTLSCVSVFWKLFSQLLSSIYFHGIWAFTLISLCSRYTVTEKWWLYMDKITFLASCSCL